MESLNLVKNNSIIYKLLFFVFLTISLFSDTIEVSSHKVVADNVKKITIFDGNVVIKKAKDIFYADKVEVYLDHNSDIEKFEATGKTKLSITLSDNTKINGQADRFIYSLKDGKIKLQGNAYVEDLTNNRKLIGEEIFIDEKEKVAKLAGKDKKPVTVIFEIKDKNGK